MVIAVEVEWAQDDLTLVLGDGVAGEEHPRSLQEQRHAAVGVTGRGDDQRTSCDVEELSVN